ncbi:vitamin D3 hydroxylase-associated protein [Patella vulgata]|uniref:vitamin D3 hydroxylase-associated protein n=1 Tax=Patella vulgata TaxID=6465 RepID=UPI00217FC00E|nr:vitamin D3 hydroxylase-associated protein [Patella vulgata]XP_050402849.1 vitamin D3 hydroxylase-associated protein [Patella vulgata]XP_050402850.1 vitamin D3 hydroxylase-associated protein [Patella vulgata]XP_050402851.1 vitamin D3 hydroxylase-associated protein [Patella vulgata]XP_050402852.1 vitamin D3 hydroxylase-associated protein [Patella vulgata]XP_050402853.1 vitamin D3 hydroxylase-associated protein [Patella vulgata]XP_050402854.1 vitamin D3 hydroxylase-associated protein [Patella
MPMPVHAFRGGASVLRKHWKLVGLGVGVLLATQIYRKYNRKRRIQQRKDEVKKSCARLRQQLQNDGINEAKSKVITDLSITQLQSKLQNGELKAIDVLRAYQYKALEVNDKTNCIVEPIKEAEVWARELDNQTGPKGKLHGIPISIKECYSIKGYFVTAGMSYFLDKVVDDDAVLVKVIKAAGAIPFVRTNIPQTMMTFECSNPLYGITTNPHDSTRSPGGSSGGEGALIGGGGSLLGIGGDIGGSIRIPCHMCGIVGLKPTEQRLSLNGSLSINTGQTHVKPSGGPMANSVDGVVLAMKVLLDDTQFILDPFVPPLKFNTQVYESKVPLRIGYYTDNGIITPVPACVRAVHEAKQALEKLGHIMVPFSPPDVHAAVARYTRTVLAERCDVAAGLLADDEIDRSYMLMYHTYQTLPTILRMFFGLLMKTQDSLAGEVVSQRRIWAMLDWWDLYDEITAYKSKFIQHWRDMNLDAVISPGFACPALPTFKSLEVSTVLSYTVLWNLLNFPAGSVPVTKVTENDQKQLNDADFYPAKKAFERKLREFCQNGVGLPVNVQCIALPYQEEVVLRLMKEIETNTK